MSHTILSYALLLLVINVINGKQSSSTRTAATGAVYTMTDALRNQVIVNRLSENGQLKVVCYVDTEGMGIHSTDYDPFFTQSRIVVYSNYLFAVNAGSNSLSMFRINPSDPTDLTLLSVKPVYGSFPVSVTVSSMYACVLTGGHTTGIRWFTYDLKGLDVVPSFDRDLTRYISQTEPPTGPLNTMSQVLFSADGHALIISIKGGFTATPYVLFFPLSDGDTKLATNPVQNTPTNAAAPFGMTLVGRNDLLITDGAKNLALTMTYSSRTGLISNSQASWVNTSLALFVCWSTYSPRTGNYYIISTTIAVAVVELQLDLRSSSTPVKIVRYYSLAPDNYATDATVVSLPDYDYLYVITGAYDIIVGYKLCGPGKAVRIGRFVQQGGNPPPNRSPYDDVYDAEKSNCRGSTPPLADPSPPHDGPLLAIPSPHTNRNRPVILGIASYLQCAQEDHKESHEH